VIERKDLKTVDTFPVWKIDSGRLLQKFEPVERNGRKLHQSMSVVCRRHSLQNTSKGH